MPCSHLILQAGEPASLQQARHNKPCFYKHLTTRSFMMIVSLAIASMNNVYDDRVCNQSAESCIKVGLKLCLHI